MDAPPQVFSNMHHAIVCAMRALGESSPYNDGSVRAKELFKRVENAPISADGGVDCGPHRFAIFNSALCGRRAAAEIFERVEDLNRPGAWWKLRIPYERALELAQQQKGARARMTRVRRSAEAGEESHATARTVVESSKMKAEIVEMCEKIQMFANAAVEMRAQNVKLEEQIQSLIDDINVLEQLASKETKEMLNTFRKSQEQIKALRAILKNTENKLFEMNKNAVQIQSGDTDQEI